MPRKGSKRNGAAPEPPAPFTADDLLDEIVAAASLLSVQPGDLTPPRVVACAHARGRRCSYMTARRELEAREAAGTLRSEWRRAARGNRVHVWVAVAGNEDKKRGTS